MIFAKQSAVGDDLIENKNGIGQIIHERYRRRPPLPLIELLLTVIAVTFWTFSEGELGLVLITFIVVPWCIRLFAGQPALRKSPLDIPLAIFALTTLSAVWISYDMGMAWGKFWVLIGGIFLYLSLVRAVAPLYLGSAGVCRSSGSIVEYLFFTHQQLAGLGEPRLS